jgi:hypothetical protein
MSHIQEWRAANGAMNIIHDEQQGFAGLDSVFFCHTGKNVSS